MATEAKLNSRSTFVYSDMMAAVREVERYTEGHDRGEFLALVANELQKRAGRKIRKGATA